MGWTSGRNRHLKNTISRRAGRKKRNLARQEKEIPS